MAFTFERLLVTIFGHSNLSNPIAKLLRMTPHSRSTYKMFHAYMQFLTSSFNSYL